MLGMLGSKFAGTSRVLSDAAAAGAGLLERLGRDGGTEGRDAREATGGDVRVG